MNDRDASFILRGDITSLMLLGEENVTGEVLRGIRAPERVTNLTIDSCPRVSTAALARFLRSASALRVVALQGAAIDDSVVEVIGSLENVEAILLFDTAITDQSLAALEGIASLRTVAIRGGAVSLEGVRKLEVSREDVEVLFGTAE
jgi:hypothetical protein